MWVGGGGAGRVYPRPLLSPAWEWKGTLAHRFPFRAASPFIGKAVQPHMRSTARGPRGLVGIALTWLPCSHLPGWNNVSPYITGSLGGLNTLIHTKLLQPRLAHHVNCVSWNLQPTPLVSLKDRLLFYCYFLGGSLQGEEVSLM